jgi:hypothetical protein
MQSKKNKILVISLFILINTFFVANKANNSVSDVGFSRIVYSQMPSTCSNQYTSYLCTSCGYGPHYDVVGLPAGGTSNFICPTAPAMQTCPNFDMGCQCLSGGISPMIRDITNTACAMGGM